jgi:glucose-6-phosphate 1-dehydrogenase
VVEGSAREVAVASQLTAQPCSLVIFGGSGDLARRKLLPALYNLALDGALPQSFAVVGVGRREMGDDAFRAFARAGVEKHSRRALEAPAWGDFERRLFYHRGGVDEPESYQRLARHLEEIEPELGIPGNRIFYLSIPPSSFATCVEQLEAAGLVTAPDSERFTRIIVEKPIGRDLESAREVNAALACAFDESQIFRIDHYLGKETVQNLLVLRFGNSIFEPLWNQKYIDHVQITVAEEEGVGSRAGYYEEAGALRDMVQNHMLQLLSLVAMEPPWSTEARVVRDHKLEVLKCLRRIRPERVGAAAVRAQYGPGFHRGVAVPGYRQEEGVGRSSLTETYVALRVYIDNWRWAGVPFFLRTGKRLPRRASEIAVQFKAVPHVLFNTDWESPLEPNVLAMCLQPDEGFSLRISAKVPGAKVQVRPVEMDFRYGEGFEGQPSPEAYERLLLDVMAGDATLYMRRDAVECSWAWIMSLLETWQASPERWLPEYDAGSAGPVEADKLIGPERRWREL